MRLLDTYDASILVHTPSNGRAGIDLAPYTAQLAGALQRGGRAMLALDENDPTPRTVRRRINAAARVMPEMKDQKVRWQKTAPEAGHILALRIGPARMRTPRNPDAPKPLGRPRKVVLASTG